MRMMAFLPGICLALFATSALAQQAGPAPAPEPGTGEVAPPPAAPPGAEPRQMEHHPRGMRHPMPMGAH